VLVILVQLRLINETIQNLKSISYVLLILDLFVCLLPIKRFIEVQESER